MRMPFKKNDMKADCPPFLFTHCFYDFVGAQ